MLESGNCRAGERRVVSHSYRIDRRPARLGGGWRLQFLENGVEVDSRVFLAAVGDRNAAKRSYVEALGCAKQWLATRA